MDVRIGLSNTVREVELELPDDTDVEALKATVAEGLGKGSPMVWLTDRKGRQVGLVVEKIAYVDLGTPADKGRIGFG